MKLTGIVLAGGKSSRMGQDKGLMVFNGKMLVEYAIDVLSPLCDEILISTNNSAYEQFGLKTIPDVFPDCGPLAGLHACLSAAEFQWSIVVSCDTPFLQPDLFQQLWLMKDGFDAVIPKHERGLEPMAGIYNKTLAGLIEQKLNDGQLKMQKFLSEVNTGFYDASGLEKKYPHLFYNINRPEQLREIST